VWPHATSPKPDALEKYFCVGVIVGKGARIVNVEKFSTGAKRFAQTNVYFLL
jgi:hypothetical protein